MTNLKYEKQTSSDNKTFHKAVNVYGNKGAGKTRFVEEAAKYLSYRYLYREGIYKIDLSKGFDQINDISSLFKTRKNSNKASNDKNDIGSSNEL